MATFASFATRLAERWHALDPAWQWAVGVYAVARVIYTVWGIVVLLVIPAIVQNLNLFGEPVVAAFDMVTGERYVYARRVGERELTFRREGDGRISDIETGSVWELRTGQAIAGEIAGQTLAAAGVTAEDVFPYHGVQPEHGVLSVWQRFDVLWYQAIAERGYDGTPNSIHFPPLYPLLERILGSLMGGRYFLAGWLIAQVALMWALALLYRMTERWQGTGTARRAVIISVLFPTAFFFFTAYSESLFLLLTLLCFTAVEREHPAWAGVWAFLAILTRLQGVALLVPLAYCAWRVVRSGAVSKAHMTRDHRMEFVAKEFASKTEPGGEKPWQGNLLMIGLPLLAMGFYVGLRAWVGDGNVVPTNEPQLNARLAMPWENVLYAVQTVASGRFLIADVLNLLTTVLAIVILARGWRILPVTLALYSAATILVVMLRYVETQPLNSMTRYVLTLFPLLMLLAYWSKNQWVERAVVYVSAPLALYLSAQFMMWGWVA